MICRQILVLVYVCLSHFEMSLGFFPVKPAARTSDADSIYGPIKEPEPCNITLDKPSKRLLWFMIYDKGADFIHLNISMKNNSEFSHNDPTKALEPFTWIWTNNIGSPLLHFDYRFDKIAIIGSISASIRYVNINITYDQNCFHSAPVSQQMDLIILAIRSAVYSPKESVHLTQGRQYVCHQMMSPVAQNGKQIKITMDERIKFIKLVDIQNSSNSSAMQLVYHCRQIARETVFKWEVIPPNVPIQALLCMVLGYILFVYSPLFVYFLIPTLGAKLRSKNRRHWLKVDDDEEPVPVPDRYNLTRWLPLDGSTPADFNILQILFLSPTKYVLVVLFRRLLLVLTSLWYIFYFIILDKIYYLEFNVRKQMKFNDADLWHIEKVIANNWDRDTIVYFVCLLIYILGGIVYIISMNYTNLLWRYGDDGIFLSRVLDDLPPPPFENIESDAEVMFNSLLYRATLPVRPLFIKIWFKDILFNLSLPKVTIKCLQWLIYVIFYPLWICFVVAYTLATLNPFGNVLLSRFKRMAPIFVNSCKDIVMFALGVVGYLVAFFVLVVVVVKPSVTLLSLVVAYSLTGLLLNYNVVLPRLMLICVAIVRVYSMVKTMKEPYLDVKNTLWQRAATRARNMDQDGVHHQDVAEPLAQDNSNEPRVPGALLQRCYNHLSPSIPVSRAKAVVSATLIICFVVFVFLTLESFHLYDDNNLSQLLVSVFLMWAPRLLSSVDQASETKRKQVLLEQRIDYMIDQYIIEQQARVNPGPPVQVM